MSAPIDGIGGDPADICYTTQYDVMQSRPFTTTTQHIAWHALHAPHDIAVIEAGASVSFQGLAAAIATTAASLTARGISTGMLVGVEHPSRFQHLVRLLACEAIGAATVSLSHAHIKETGSNVPHCDRVLVDNPAVAGQTSRVITIPDSLPAAPAAVDFKSLERPVDPALLARVWTTSGTTGWQKWVPLTGAMLQRRIVQANERLPPDILPKPRMLCLYNLTQGANHTRSFGTLQLGGTVVFATAQEAWGLVAAGAVNHLLFTAGDLERMVPHAQPPPAGRGLHLLVFGAPLDRHLRNWARDWLKASLTNPYGTIETSSIAMINDDGTGDLCPGTEICIVDADGREVPQGEAGVIRVRTEAMASGYFKNPAMTAAGFIDGWHQTGDIGLLTETGRLRVLGRADDMLNIGGVKVAPAAIETALKQVAGVRDATVMSVSTPGMANRLVAALEIGAPPLPPALAEAVFAVMRRHASVFDVIALRSFPRTESAKIKRHEIEAEYRRSRTTGQAASGP